MKAFHVTLWEYAKNLIPFDSLQSAVNQQNIFFRLSTLKIRIHHNLYWNEFLFTIILIWNSFNNGTLPGTTQTRKWRFRPEAEVTS